MKPIELAQQLDTEFRSSCVRLNRDEPWFGRVTLRVGKDEKPYKIGARRVPDERILDWRHPLARAYYEIQPGEDFELDQHGFAKLAGVVETQATLTTQERSVRRVALRTESGNVELIATDVGFCTPEDELRGRVRGPTRADGLPDVLALLTPVQYRLITASTNNPVIIQGSAGSGKTTVALYRVAWLTYADEHSNQAPVDPSRVLIVMFNKALSSFVRQGLTPLKLEAARLDTFHGWALDEIRRSYRGIIEPDPAPRAGHEIAAALKKQLGMLSALDAFVSKQTQALESWLGEKLAPYKARDWQDRYTELKTPVVRRLVTLRGQALAQRDAANGVEQQRLTQVHAILDTAVRRMTQYKEELLKFLTDTSLLAAHLPKASATDLNALSSFQNALQGDGGSERRPGPKVAFEDFALLLRLIQLKNGGYPDKAREEDVRVYDHLVIDEAQDFGAVELTALLASVRSRTGVTIVGDLNQKILPDVDFIGWDALAKELGVTGAEVTRLEVVHRSTPAIMRVADAILGEKNTAASFGAAPTLTIARSADELIDCVAELARNAYFADRSGHVCVVCRTSNAASKLVEPLGQRLADVDIEVRLGHNRQFVFAPGITVSSSRQIKGLEFDTVIVVDPSAREYPHNTDAQRALYMVVTRAREQLHFVTSAPTTELLAGALETGLIEVVHTQSVPPVQFTEEDDKPF